MYQKQWTHLIDLVLNKGIVIKEVDNKCSIVRNRNFIQKFCTEYSIEQYTYEKARINFLTFVSKQILN